MVISTSNNTTFAVQVRKIRVPILQNISGKFPKETQFFTKQKAHVFL